MVRSLKLSLLAMLAPAALYAATVNGIVTIQGGTDPVAGAKIVLTTFQGGLTADSTVTDVKGAYSFANKAVGNYVIVATATNYQVANSTVNVVAATGTTTKNLNMRPIITIPNLVGTITGTVKDDSTKEAIANATIILSHSAGRGQPTPIDTVVTDGEGRFVFAAVTALSSYILVTTKPGFSLTTKNNVAVIANDTTKVAITLKVLPKPTAIILGKVTDAASKAAIGGAKVLLRMQILTQAGFGWESLDSVQSAADGTYKFDSLAASTVLNAYSIIASKVDYNTFTTPNIIVANNVTDTVNIALVAVTKGTINIFVGFDSTGNAALAGAAVVVTQQGQGGLVYTGTTDAKGWVTIPNVISSAYNVSASLAGYVSKEVVRNVGADEKDTGYIYLARATAQNSKTLSGIVRDAGGKAIAGASVSFQASNGGIKIVTTTTATGDYSVAGIPNQTNGGAITVSKAGFADFTGPVTLNVAANFLNVTLQVPVSLTQINGLQAKLQLHASRTELTVDFSGGSVLGNISLYNSAGKQLLAKSFASGLSKVSLSRASLGNAMGMLVINQGATQQKMLVSALP